MDGYGTTSMVEALKRVVVKHPRAAFVSQQSVNDTWEAYGYQGCPNFSKALNEYETFLEILYDYVPEVLFLEEDLRTGLDSLYAHDAVKFTPEGAILLSPSKVLRQNEPQAWKTQLAKWDIAILGEISGAGRIEGGDVVWIDENTVLMGNGYRSNQEGISQFLALLKNKPDALQVPLPHADGPDACLHLMSIISMVDRDLAVVYSRYMPVMLRQWLVDRGIVLIEVSDQEYATLGGNVLALAPRVCVMLEGNPETRRALERHGATVLTYPGQEISLKGTGGPTCLTAPLWRHS